MLVIDFEEIEIRFSRNWFFLMDFYGRKTINLTF